MALMTRHLFCRLDYEEMILRVAGGGGVVEKKADIFGGPSLRICVLPEFVEAIKDEVSKRRLVGLLVTVEALPGVFTKLEGVVWRVK